MSEEDLVSVIAEWYFQQGAVVLTASPNQITAFRYVLANGRRKAPDLAMVVDKTLFIGEAKTRFSELFKVNRGYSDVDSLDYLAKNELAQQSLLEEAATRLGNSVGRNYPTPQFLSVFTVSILCKNTLADKNVLLMPHLTYDRYGPKPNFFWRYPDT